MFLSSSSTSSLSAAGGGGNSGGALRAKSALHYHRHGARVDCVVDLFLGGAKAHRCTEAQAKHLEQNRCLVWILSVGAILSADERLNEERAPRCGRSNSGAVRSDGAQQVNGEKCPSGCVCARVSSSSASSSSASFESAERVGLCDHCGCG